MTNPASPRKASNSATPRTPAIIVWKVSAFATIAIAIRVVCCPSD